MQVTSESSNQRKPNRLSREKSPYLLQHQHNPVDWYAWGAEAFEKARREDKPIFLSIGYSTCHWCHVMERESFENETIAAYLNEHFVSIKLDREERPDVDKIYMTFVQATTGSGGWPLNVFLTPDLKPFFGGTYFPPDNRHGRGAFLDVLKQVQAAWTSRRDDLTNSAVRMHEHLVQATGSIHAPQAVPGEDALTHAGDVLKQGYDPHHGGFGQAPKFPQPSHPQFLLRFAKRFKDEQAKRMVLYTCEQMAAGGIHDQLGGGFSRYSVDAEWLVPHFEKMLYDNAQLACLYLDAYQVSGSPIYGDVARDILDYVVRDMRHPEGGFYSAEDADSEGHEGKFYCWTRAEMAEVLAPPELQVAEQYFGITDQGNFVDHSHPTPLRGQNVLSVVRPELAASSSALLRSAKEKLLAARSARVRPHLDDKVLASWNGLMLAAFSRGSVVLGESKFAAAAEQCARFMRQRLWDEGTKTLYHRWREGERDRVELLEGYAFLALGMVELYEATLSPGHLEFALELADGMVTRFYDPENGGFWQSPKACTDLILRVKEDYDGAEPSGNSVATMVLLKLASICARPDLREAAEKTLSLFATRLEQVPQAMPFMMQALDFSLQEPFRVVVTGNQNQTEGLLRAIHSVYQPNKVVLGSVGMVDPFARALKTAAEPLAYICTGSECRPPTSDPKELKASLV